jgi:hypothetical protein
MYDVDWVGVHNGNSGLDNRIGGPGVFEIG